MEKQPVEVPEGAETLVRNLERRQRLLSRISGKEEIEIPEIKIKDTLLRFLEREYEGLSEEEKGDLNSRVFMLINRAASIAKTNKQDTSPVTAIYAHQRRDARPIDEDTYQTYKQEVKEIINLCREYNISLKSITGMQNGLGLPETAKLDTLLAWCKANSVDLKSITGMQAGLGLPETAKLDTLLAWCKANSVDLKSITGMQAGLGLPETAKLDTLLAWCKANSVDLKSITGMQAGLGLPETAKLDTYLFSRNSGI